MKTPQNIICYGQTRGANFVQEHYETSSRHARLRAKAIRTAGFECYASALGPQFTVVGIVRMTMLTIHPKLHMGFDEMPSVRSELSGSDLTQQLDPVNSRQVLGVNRLKFLNYVCS